MTAGAPSEQVEGLEVHVLPDPERGPVTADGPLRSVQEAELAIEASTLEELWRPETWSAWPVATGAT